MRIGIVLLLLLAPEDPAQMLRVAWASQYEWKEDNVKSVTIDFRYSHSWGEKGESKRDGQGQVVIVGDDVVRRHYPDAADDDARKEIDEHVSWALKRFVRKPFEEVFKDAKFTGPEKSAFDQMKISLGTSAWFVKDDRIVAAEYDMNPGGKPDIVRADFKLADIGGGYAIVGETVSFTRKTDGMKVTQERTLVTKTEADRPAPSAYTFERKSAKEKERFTIDFASVRFDLPEPVILNPAARDLLKDAWSHRLVLPDNIIVQGEFHRNVDKDLERARWKDDVRGNFQVYGMDNVQVTLDGEDDNDLLRTCEGHVRGIFRYLRDLKFDEEFKGCGFELEPQGTDSIVRVYGYPGALAFRISGGQITGHYQKVLSETGWWTYKTKSAGDGRFQIEQMKREIEGKKITLEFDYQKVRGYTIPKKVDVLATPYGFRGTAVGLATYSFRRAKVSFPGE
jgi:hypothetical protein